MSFAYGAEFEVVPIIHLGRSGSTYLERSLASSLSAMSLGEIFNKNVTTPYLNDRMSWASFFGKDAKSFLIHSILRGLEAEYWATRKSNEPMREKRLIFIEYKPTLIDHAFHSIHSVFLCHLRELGVRRIIVLERRSVLRRILSSQVAQRTGIYHSDQITNGKVYSPDPLYFDFNKVVDDGINPGYGHALVEVQAANDLYFSKLRLELVANGFEKLDILYERDVCGPITDLIQSIARFLGTEVHGPAVSGLKKTLPNDLERIVSNVEPLLNYCQRNSIRL